MSKATVYLVKVALTHRKKIWRRIAIRSDQTLCDLHWAIYQAFDRYEDHLYSFYIAPAGLKGRAATVEAMEYTHPMCLEDPGPFGGDERTRNAEETTIDSLRLTPGRQFRYLFDFGDNWEHQIMVEATDTPVEPGKKYPSIVEKHGDSPDQYPEQEE
jgi:hypothetical protein